MKLSKKIDIYKQYKLIIKSPITKKLLYVYYSGGEFCKCTFTDCQFSELHDEYLCYFLNDGKLYIPIFEDKESIPHTVLAYCRI